MLPKTPLEYPINLHHSAIPLVSLVLFIPRGASPSRHRTDGRTCTMRFDRLESTHNACINPLTIGRLYLLVWCSCAALNGIMNRISTGTSSPWIYLDILCPELCRLGVPHASSRATGPFESLTHDKSANRTQASLGGC